MSDWRRKKRSEIRDDMYELPGSDILDRMEAAKAWGLSWDEWLRKPVVRRAEMLAHEMHRNLRAAWYQAHPKPAAKPGDSLHKAMEMH